MKYQSSRSPFAMCDNSVSLLKTKRQFQLGHVAPDLCCVVIIIITTIIIIINIIKSIINKANSTNLYPLT